MKNFLFYISEFNSIYGICPCCNELFKLSEANIKFPEKQLPNDPIYKVKKIGKKVELEEEKLERYEEKFLEKMNLARQEAQERGRKSAKNILRKIDPFFSGRNLDPQDAKTIFHPIEFISFNGLNSDTGLIKNIEFIGFKPDNKEREAVIKSLMKSVKNGNYNFETVTIDNSGNLIRK